MADPSAAEVGYAYLRQSPVPVPDLAAMAKRAHAKHLMLLDASAWGRTAVPLQGAGGPLSEADYREAAEGGGFAANFIVGTALATLRLPMK